MAARVKKYGITCDPLPNGESMSPVLIDLILAKHGREHPYHHGTVLDPQEHLLRACRALFTKEQFSVSRWTEEHAYDFCNADFAITIGSASSGKSNDYGLFGLLSWLTDPKETYVLLASTTVQMLKLRSFESVIRYFKILKRHPQFKFPGKESKVAMAVVNDDDAEETDVTGKACVRACAIQQGTIEEARANLAGVHLPWVIYIVDELSQVREAAMEARVNLSIGAKRFQFFGLANPDSIHDLAGRYCKPKAKDGWLSVTKDTEYWESDYGTVRHHNGMTSPAIVEKDGEAKYPYLINRAQIDRLLKENGGNDDAPIFWTMVYGFPPPQSIKGGVLSEALLNMYQMTAPVIWEQENTLLVSLDAAFSEGGDQCIFQVARMGYSKEGIMTLAYGDTISFKIEASSETPVVYQIANQVRDQQQVLGFSMANFAIDDSGSQSVADVIEKEIGKGVFRVVYGAVASDKPVSVFNERSAREVYADRVTEAWYAVREFGQFNQIRALPAQAAEEFCQRLTLDRRPLRLEDKKTMRKRIKRSPDVGDACAQIALMARERLGFIPGATKLAPGGAPAATMGFDPEWVRRVNNFNLTADRYRPPVGGRQFGLK